MENSDRTNYDEDNISASGHAGHAATAAATGIALSKRHTDQRTTKQQVVPPIFAANFVFYFLFLFSPTCRRKEAALHSGGRLLPTWPPSAP